MTLQEIFDQLTYGELSQLSIGGGESGEISENNIPRIIPHINLALTTLYKRFPLKQGRVKLSLIQDRQQYQINSKYAINNTKSRELVRYIDDSAGLPFKDDLIKVERILTDGELDLAINDHSNPYSIITPSMDSILVPLAIVNQSAELTDYYKTKNLQLIYRASHPKIVQGIGYFDPTRVQVELPEVYLEPLLLFIASRMFSPIGTGQFDGLAGNNYMQKYELACKQIEQSNLQIDQVSQGSRLRDNGWA